jgi:hypothetical protein
MNTMLQVGEAARAGDRMGASGKPSSLQQVEPPPALEPLILKQAAYYQVCRSVICTGPEGREIAVLRAGLWCGAGGRAEAVLAQLPQVWVSFHWRGQGSSWFYGPFSWVRWVGPDLWCGEAQESLLLATYRSTLRCWYVWPERAHYENVVVEPAPGHNAGDARDPESYADRLADS